jgi:hypothetical protein
MTTKIDKFLRWLIVILVLIIIIAWVTQLGVR